MKLLWQFFLIIAFGQIVYAGEIVITVTEEDGKQKTVKHVYEDDAVNEPAKDQGVDPQTDLKFNEVMNQFKKNEKAMEDIEKQMKDDLHWMQGSD